LTGIWSKVSGIMFYIPFIKTEMGLREKIYKNLPVLFQDLSVSGYGYFWKKRRYGGIFTEELRKFRDRERLTRRQMQEYQVEELRKLLIHAFQTVPLYRRKYTAAGFTLDHFRNFTLDDLKKLPFLEKEELRNFGTSELLSSELDKNGDYFSSSGSTGTPTRIYLSHHAHQRVTAAYEARVRNWAGLNMNMARGMVGGRRVVAEAVSPPPYYRYNFAEKQVYFSAYHISESTIPNYVKGMKKYGIEYMCGYAMSNFLIAQLISENNIQAPVLKAVLTSSEKLTDEMRDTINRVYNCKTFDGYSGVEYCGLISENEYNQKLISEDVGILEVVDENFNDTDEGELISTGLLNYDQPLIRYRIGDRIKLAREQSARCGREFRVVDEIIGRTEDLVIGQDGRKMVRFHGIFINIDNLERGQIIQHKADEIEVVLQCREKIAEKDINLIRERLRSQLGDLTIRITTTDNIPLTANGKFKAVISHISK
jgi:phenylacetate-CoA ligase